MPISAPTLGLSDAPWGPAWVAVRSAAKLSADVQGTLLPARGLRGWLDVDFTSTEFAASFRSLLLRHGFSYDELALIGAHSCKVTTLSWLAKWGASKECRKMLGYHALREDRTMDAYSRDSMAGPLRTLEKCIEAVRLLQFRPDETRSGAFIRPSAQPPPQESPQKATSSSSSSSCSSESSLASEDVPAEEEVDGNLVLNGRTGFYHRLDGDGLTCLCGKLRPGKAIVFSEVLAGGRLCSRCF